MTSTPPAPVRPDRTEDWIFLGTGQRLRLAKPLARLAARIIDLIILVGIGLLISSGFQGFGNVDLSTPPTTIWAETIATALFSSLYEIAFVAWKGQTLGKMVVGIRIVGLDGGGLPRLGESIRRWSLPALLSVPVYFIGADAPSSGAEAAIWAVAMVGIVLVVLCHAWLMWDRYRRGWNDMIASTIVVKIGGGRMDRNDREARSGEQDRARSEPAGALGSFPWAESGTGEQPPQVWEQASKEQPDGPGGSAGPGHREDGVGNPMAITGFVLSLVMWIALVVPPLSVALWVLALTFSSIGLSRSTRRGAPYKGLAIAGLSISLIGVVIVVIAVLLLVGAAVNS